MLDELNARLKAARAGIDDCLSRLEDLGVVLEPPSMAMSIDASKSLGDEVKRVVGEVEKALRKLERRLRLAEVQYGVAKAAELTARLKAGERVPSRLVRGYARFVGGLPAFLAATGASWALKDDAYVVGAAS